MYERRPPRWAKNRRISAKLDVVLGVARVLYELTWCGGCDSPAAKAGCEPHPCAVYIASRIRKDPEDLRIVLKLHARLRQDGVGICLNLLQPGIAEDIEGRELAQNERRTRFGWCAFGCRFAAA